MRFIAPILFVLAFVTPLTTHAALKRAAEVRRVITELQSLSGSTETPAFTTIRRTLFAIAQLDRKSPPIAGSVLGLRFAEDVVEWFDTLPPRPEDELATQRRAENIVDALFQLLESQFSDRPTLAAVRNKMLVEVPRQIWARLVSGTLIRVVDDEQTPAADPRLLEKLQTSYLERTKSCVERIESAKAER